MERFSLLARRFILLSVLKTIRIAQQTSVIFGVKSNTWEYFAARLMTSLPADFPINALGRLYLGPQKLSKLVDSVVGIVSIPAFPAHMSWRVPRSAVRSIPVEVIRRSERQLISHETYPNLTNVTVPVGRFGEKRSRAKLFASGTAIDLNNIAKNRFSHFGLDLSAGDYLETDQENVVAGEPIPDSEKLVSKTTDSSSAEDVTVIFVDGLATEFFNHVSMKDLMPRTTDFFSDAHEYVNFRSCAEWTLPSVASFFSGQEPLLHDIWRPGKQEEFSSKSPLLSEAFDWLGYFTSMIGGSWRAAPGYGYVRGFDRTLFKHEASLDWSISRHIALQDAFPHRSHFSWISVGEIHPPWSDGVPPLEVQSKIPAEFLARVQVEKGTKSPFELESSLKLTSYLVALHDLDKKLERLYDRIRRREAGRRQTVVLLSDHGQSYFPGGAKSVLSDYRTRVPFLIRDSSLGASRITSPIQSSDLARVLLDLVDAPKLGVGDGGQNFGGLEQGFTLSESIFPMRHYLCRINTESDYVEFASRAVVARDGKLSSSELVPVESSSSEISSLSSVGNLKQSLEERIERSGLMRAKN